MKNIRQLFSATVLTLTICSVAFAGDVWNPGIVNPPPLGGGRGSFISSKNEVAAFDTLTETTMFLRKSMLSLF